MTITLNAGNEKINNYTQRELKDLFTTILSTDETFEVFNESHSSDKREKLIENSNIFCVVDGKHTLLILDISRDSAKSIIFKYNTNHFVDLKNGFAKVMYIDAREVDTLVKFGFSTPNKNYKDIIEDRDSN